MVGLVGRRLTKQLQNGRIAWAPSVANASTTYRPAFAMLTKMRNDQNGSRRTPERTVNASPNRGIHDSRSDQRPNLRYQPSALCSWASLTGNQDLSRYRSM